MKKIVLFGIIALLCASVISCGVDKVGGPTGGKDTVTETEAVSETAAASEAETQAATSAPEDADPFDTSLIVGRWKNLTTHEHGFEIEIRQYGTVSAELSGAVIDGTWEVAGNTLSIILETKTLEFNICEENGAVYLDYTDGYYYLVPAEVYDSHITTYELTLDNYGDYFTVEKYCDVIRNDEGKVTNVRYGHKLALREEYRSTFAGLDGALELTQSGGHVCIVSARDDGTVSVGMAYSATQLASLGYGTPLNRDVNVMKLNQSEDGDVILRSTYALSDASINVDGDTVTADVTNYKSVEITKMLGKIFLVK